MNRRKTLTAAFVKTVRTPGRYGDGRGSHGLSLLVKDTTTDRVSRSWAQRLRINGQLFSVGLGSYPIVNLAGAREKALQNAKAAAKGVDPRIPARKIPSFAEAVDAVIAARSEVGGMQKLLNVGGRS